MTLKDIKDHYEVRKISGYYALYDRNKSIYRDYRGHLSYPFIGCVRNKGKNFVFIYHKLSPYDKCEKQINNISELNAKISDYIAKVESCGITTDCYNPMLNTVSRCELAAVQYVQNNTKLGFDDRYKLSTKIANTTLSIEKKENKCCISVDYGKGFYTYRVFDDPFEVLCYIKPIIKIILLASVITPIKSIQMINDTDVKHRFDLYAKDVLYKVEADYLNIHKVGKIKEYIINELEEILRQLKQ